MKEFYITIKNNQTGEVEKQSGEIPDDQWGQALKFLACYSRLAECGIARTQSKLNFEMNWTEGSPLVHTASLSPEDDIAAFLHRMRPFVLRERTNFHKVRNVLARYLTLPSLRKHLDGLRDRYSGKAIGFSIRVGALDLTTEEAIDKWMNAFEYHQDDDKQRELRAMYEIFPETSARVLFLYAMLQRASAIEKLGALIDGLSKRDGREHRFRS